MPFVTGLLEGLKAVQCTFSRGAADGEFHGKCRNAENGEKQKIQKNEQTAAVFTGDIGETPDVADADRTPGADEDES